MEMWTGILIGAYALKAIHYKLFRLPAQKKAQADYESKIIDLRERINAHDDRLKTVEANPYIRLGHELALKNRDEEQQHKQAS